MNYRKQLKRVKYYIFVGLLLGMDLFRSTGNPAKAEEATRQELAESLEIAPYLNMLVGPKEISTLKTEESRSGAGVDWETADAQEATAAGESADVQESADTLDLEALKQYIEGKYDTFQNSVTETLVAEGFSEDGISFSYSEEKNTISRRILAMTAVFRGYTFYNRIVCQWYVDNLWNEMLDYQTVENEDVTKSVELFVKTAAKVCDLWGIGGQTAKQLQSQYEGMSAQKTGQVLVTARSDQELYGIDSPEFRIPIEWNGWTQEKQSEYEELLAMDETEFEEQLKVRQEESLLDSPVPLYKQGAIEWGSQPFGNGTLASDACCPTAIAMVVSYFKNERITPAQIAARYDRDEYRNAEQGSYGAKMCAAAASDYGLQAVTGTEALSESQIREVLAAGSKIVMSMKPGDGGGRYATVYHYVVLAGLTEDGKVIVNNPGVNTDVSYDDMATILSNQSGRGYGVFGS